MKKYGTFSQTPSITEASDEPKSSKETNPLINSPSYNSITIWSFSATIFLGYFIFNYNLGVFTSSHPSVSASLHWDSNENLYVALMSSLLPLGAFFGAIMSSNLSSYFGRRDCIILANILTIVACFLSVIPTTLTFALGRFLSGAGVAIFTVFCNTFVREIAPRQICGQLMSLIQPIGVSGIITAYGFALVLPVDNYSSDSLNRFWYFMFSFVGFVAGLQMALLLIVFRFESPLWLISKGQEAEARKSIEFFYGSQEVDFILNQFKQAETGSEYSIKDFLLFKIGRRAMKISVIMHILQQFSGINAIILYSTTLFGQFGSSVFESRLFTLIMGVVSFSSSFLLIPLIDTLGRKILLVTGMLAMSICLLLLAYFSSSQTLYVESFLLILGYIGSFGTSLGPICWIYSGEILTSKAMSICSSLNFLCSFVVILCFPFVVQLIGLTYTFLMFAMINLAGAGFNYWEMIETKGMDRKDIQDVFYAN